MEGRDIAIKIELSTTKITLKIEGAVYLTRCQAHLQSHKVTAGEYTKRLFIKTEAWDFLILGKCLEVSGKCTVGLIKHLCNSI